MGNDSRSKPWWARHINPVKIPKLGLAHGQSNHFTSVGSTSLAAIRSKRFVLPRVWCSVLCEPMWKKAAASLLMETTMFPLKRTYQWGAASSSAPLGPNHAVNSDAPVHIFCFAHAAGGAPVT